MKDLFSEGKLIAEVRKNDRGSHFLIETLKYFFVIFTVTYFANWVHSFVVNHSIKPLAELPGLWNYAMIMLAAGAVLYCLIWEKMSLRQIGILRTGFKKTVVHYCVGLGLGLLLISLAALLALALRVLDFGKNLHNVKWISFFIILLSYLVQGFGEEVLFRGAFLLSTVRKNSPIISIAVSSLFFSLWHYKTASYGVLPAVNLFLFGVLCAVSVFVFNHVWFAGAFHAAWNFAQAHVFGVSVSGSTPNVNSTILISKVHGSALLSGGDYGLEGSLLTSIVLIAAIAAILFYNHKRDRKDKNEP